MKSSLIDSGQYAIARHMDTFTQLHVARKMAVSVGLLDKIFSEDNPPGLFSLLTFASMKDEDVDFVMQKCLAVVSKRDMTGKFFPLLNSSGVLQYADTPLSEVLELVMCVVERDLLDFFSTALVPSNVPSQPQVEQVESQGQ